ncbi:esterase family protein [bacterium]|nr:esterase family protein [bacterium]RQV98050.1 MAG: esterase family protein [bacterium]
MMNRYRSDRFPLFLGLLIVLIIFSTVAVAQEEAQPEQRPPQTTGRQMWMPEKGVCPLPILSALPTYEDTTFYTRQNVPHGRVESVTYMTSAGVEKRMHIYLPPGYDQNSDMRYPVLYLNHGGGDDDSKWTAVSRNAGGCANDILDNLIAAGKAKPMMIVMPNTRGIVSGNPPVLGQDDVCTEEYVQSIIPYVDSHYRTKANRENRAIAGLSMGGFVVLHTGLLHLDLFSELYVYSSGHTSEETQTAFEENFKELLTDPNTNNLFRVPLYMAAGETDIALRNSQKILAIFNNYGIRNFWVFSDGGHDWINWKRYLYQTAQIMFPDCDPQ